MTLAYESFFFGSGPNAVKMFTMFGDNGSGSDGGSYSSTPFKLANGRAIMSILSQTDGPARGVYNHIYGFPGQEIDLASAVVMRINGNDNNYSASTVNVWPISGNNFLAEFWVGPTNCVWVMSFDGTAISLVSQGDASWSDNSQGIIGKGASYWLTTDYNGAYVQVDSSGNRAGGRYFGTPRGNRAFAPDGALFKSTDNGDIVYRIAPDFSGSTQVSLYPALNGTFNRGVACASSNYYVLGGYGTSDGSGFFQARFLIYPAGNMNSCRSVYVNAPGSNRLMVVRLAVDPADQNTMFFLLMGDGGSSTEWRNYYFGSINLTTGAINWCRQIAGTWASKRLQQGTGWIYPTTTNLSVGWSDNYDTVSNVYRARIMGPGPKDSSFPTGNLANVGITAVTPTTTVTTLTNSSNDSVTGSSSSVYANYVPTRYLIAADPTKISIASTSYFGG